MLSLVIPCYNEELGIPNLVSKLNPVLEELQNDYHIELIFVDDGSTDHTNELLHQHYGNWKNASILKHERNKNLGAALKTGFAHAHGDLIAAWDSDCTYPPSLLPQMLELLDGNTSIVTVSPYHPQGKVENVPAYRIFLSKSISLIYRFLLNSGIYTHSAMVRVYRKEVIDNVKFKSDDFLSVAELLVKARLQGYRIRELPATLQVRQYGVSKMKLLHTIHSHLKMVGKIVLYRLFGREI